ncbi:hypothetical protein NQ314_009196 [Rhamnusium bicolor]|uniref:PiggyBac transposable element-derived protein domain-containing protein n=1 Tax=Rhamnusium bicolor TaxID=1586634 RepID=A0AAV8Y5M2_9CUCU|nr:hypothetical protein NQ314_009196 [Rhamnusium bicolor]
MPLNRQIFWESLPDSEASADLVNSEQMENDDDGRLVMRQYIKNKRHRYGIKLFKLCSSGGFTYSMQTYAGKNLELQKTTPTSMVMNLCQPILNYGQTVITDNWYINVELAHAIVPTQNRIGNIKYEPQMVPDYNAGKSAVDLLDQMTAYQSPLRKSLKWYRKLAIEIILYTAIVNAWIIYKGVTKEQMSILNFRKRVTYNLCKSIPIEDLVEPMPTEKRKRHDIGTKS